MSLGPAEILVILVIALLVFGPNRLPEIGRQVGRGVRELRRFQQSLKSDLDDVLADDTPPPRPRPPRPASTDADTPAVEAGDTAATPDIQDAAPPPPAPDST